MKECEYCGEEFEGEEDLHIHWLNEHEDEINSHQRNNAKKAKREREERKKVRKEQRKKYLYQGVGGAVLLLVVAVLGSQLIPSGGGSTEISLEGEPMIGNESANVTVVEFGDLQCPACNQFHQTVYSRIKSEYIDTGKIKFYWKDYPLEQIHPWARTAAETMECVYRQDNKAFWNVKDTLFDNQNSLNQGNVQSQIISWAENEGVNSSEIRACLQNQNPGEEVTRDSREGRANGVTGTPSIYVNGEKLPNFRYNTVSQAIEEALNN